MTEESGHEIVVKQNAEELQLQETQIVSENSLGCSDGHRFYLQRFPVWQQTRKVASSTRATNTLYPEEGQENGVLFWQSMGMIFLQYPLAPEIKEADIEVQFSSWQMQVTIGGGKANKELSGELHKDIRKKLSSWQVVEDDAGQKTLAITLAKKAHKGWKSIWFDDVFNPHKRKAFPWDSVMNTRNIPDPEDDKMTKVGPGTQDVLKELVLTTDTSRLCTGVDLWDEDDLTISFLIWLDEEALDQCLLRLPLEEIFAADVEENYMEVYIRADAFGLCWGQLTGSCVPDMTTWEILKNVRRQVPKTSGIRCPAFYSPALMVRLVKNYNSQFIWGQAFQDMQHADFPPPKERMSHTERLQRSMTLTPVGFMENTTKAERAKVLYSKFEATQDDRFAYISLHVDTRLEQAAERFHVDLTGFFLLNVGTEFMEVKVLADMEYHMIIGKLGGECLPEMASWDIGRNQANEFVLKVTIMKAPGSKGLWEEPIFSKMELHELTQMFIDNAAQEMLDPAQAESMGGKDEGEGIE